MDKIYLYLEYGSHDRDFISFDKEEEAVKYLTASSCTKFQAILGRPMRLTLKTEGS